MAANPSFIPLSRDRAPQGDVTAETFPSKTPRFITAGACSLAYVVSFLVLASVLRTTFGFPLDDSWIHEVIARNLAEYKVLGFVPGELTSGSTSLLWSLILALRPLAFPGLSPVIYCAGISVVLFGGIGYVFKAITEEDGLAALPSWCIALAPAASGNFLWFGLIGMEHLLFILLSLCLIQAVCATEGQRPRLVAISLPGLAFLLVLTRPEGICLVGLLFLFGMRSHPSRTKHLLAMAGGLCAAAIFGFSNWKTGHHLTPLTMQGRQEVLSANSWFTARLEFLSHVFARLLSVWGIDLPVHVLHGKGLLIGLPLSAAIIVLIVLAVRQLYKFSAQRMLLLCSWAGFILVLYFFMLPTPGHGGRYVAVPVMLFLPLVFFGLQQVLLLIRLSRLTAISLLILSGFGTALTSIHVWRSVATADIEQIDTEHGAIAAWIEQYIPSEEIRNNEVAVFDIGRIGYQLHGHLIDLGGLVDYKLHPYILQHRTATYLQDRGVKYVVLPGIRDSSDTLYQKLLSLQPANGVGLTFMHENCADADVAALAFHSSNTALECQRLYRIHYRDAGAPHSY